MGDEVGEEAVDGDAVGELVPVGDAERAVVAVAGLCEVDAVFGGEHRGTGDIAHVVRRRHPRAEGGQGLEAVDDAPAVELKEPFVGGSAGGPADLDDLVGGQDPVLVQQPGDPPVSRSEVVGEVREVFGVGDDAGGGT